MDMLADNIGTILSAFMFWLFFGVIWLVILSWVSTGVSSPLIPIAAELSYAGHNDRSRHVSPGVPLWWPEWGASASGTGIPLAHDIGIF